MRYQRTYEEVPVIISAVEDREWCSGRDVLIMCDVFAICFHDDVVPGWDILGVIVDM